MCGNAQKLKLVVEAANNQNKQTQQTGVAYANDDLIMRCIFQCLWLILTFGGNWKQSKVIDFCPWNSGCCAVLVKTETVTCLVCVFLDSFYAVSLQNWSKWSVGRQHCGVRSFLTCESSEILLTCNTLSLALVSSLHNNTVSASHASLTYAVSGKKVYSILGITLTNLDIVS